MNSFRYTGIDPDTKKDVHVCYAGELRGYKTSKDLIGEDKSYAAVTIPAGGEATYNLVFIQKDSDFNDNIPYIKFYATGTITPEYDKQSIYVRLK